MQKAIIGKKIGMTQIFDEKGRVVPVTVVEVAGERLAHALRLLIAEANLNCIVAVVFNSLLLCDNTRTG